MNGFVRKKNNRWYYTFDIGMVDGKRKRIERAGGKTKKDAEKALREAIYKYENVGVIDKKINLTLNAYLDYWFESYVKLNCKYNTINSYESIIRLHINPVLGHYKISSLKPAILQEFINGRVTNGISKNFLSCMFGVLSGALKYATYPMEYISSNPMEHVKMPKYSVKQNSYKNKILSLENMEIIDQKFPVGSKFYIPIQIAINTGMRGGEVCSLIWDDIDLDNRIIHVNTTYIYKSKGVFERTSPKTKSSVRSILIGKTLTEILTNELSRQADNKMNYGANYNDNCFVCRSENGNHVSTEALKYLSRIVRTQLKIEFSFHSYRHTHATMLLENGANFKDIQLRLGHSKLSTTMDTYSHVTKNLSNQTVDIIESLIDAKNNKPSTIK